MPNMGDILNHAILKARAAGYQRPKQNMHVQRYHAHALPPAYGVLRDTLLVAFDDLPSIELNDYVISLTNKYYPVYHVKGTLESINWDNPTFFDIAYTVAAASLLALTKKGNSLTKATLDEIPVFFMGTMDALILEYFKEIESHSVRRF